MDNTDNQLRARTIVANYFNDNRESTDENILRAEIEEITLKEVHIVWFSKTLKNWKALVTTDIPDDVYYEVTHNGNKDETYLDIYKKINNVIIPDGRH